MKKNLRWFTIIMACLLVLTTAVGCSSTPSQPAPQQEEQKGWVPEKPFELLVPMSAGGGSDVFARNLVKVIEDNKLCPQTIVVVNKPGGSGSIGWTYVAKDHKGNPYEISTTSSSFYTGPIAGQSPVSYKDFTHIINLCEDPNLILVKADSPYKTIKDLLDAAKANPDKISAAGSSGLSVDAIAFYTMQDAAGVKMKYVPFGGGGEVLTALLGGHVDFAYLSPSEAGPQIEAGKVRAIAVTTEDRMGGAMADIPTLKESGYDVVIAQARGVVAPLDIPEEAVAFLQDMFKKAIETPEWKEFLANNYMEEKVLIGEDFYKLSEEITSLFTKYLDKIEAAK
ncbi:MAG TPA: tripartite tricarboxylate transporter substrate binding protein [Peptococcaceae bacterium]|nr:tripartite tricarboxylate transporter substrate binding protein [Peptococcaceae bacterium]